MFNDGSLVAFVCVTLDKTFYGLLELVHGCDVGQFHREKAI